MALKRRAKISPNFSMASMTDVIFLLLIFFMITSTVVSPNAIKVLLPQGKQQTSAKPLTRVIIDKDLNFYIYDVAPRIGGGTNVHMNVGHAYGNALWRTNMSTGRRLAMEIRRAIEDDRVKEIVT